MSKGMGIPKADERRDLIEAHRQLSEARAKVARAEALADKWERDAGPDSRAAGVFGPQKVSVEYAVRAIRAALRGEQP